MDDKELIERLVSLEKGQSLNDKRITVVENEVKENRELTIAVKEIATEMKHLREEQTNMNERLKAIEEKPLKEYEETKKQAKKTVLAFVLGIILTFLAIKLGLENYL